MANTLMEVLLVKELLENIAKFLVDNPDKVNVTQVDGNDSVVLELRVAPEDMGKVIGKQGRIAKAVRTLIRAYAVKENKRVSVEIME